MAYKMGISVSSMKKIINGQENFSPNNLDFYLNNNHLHLWEFILQAVPLNHLPEKIQKKVDICKNLSEKIEKNKE